MQLKRKAVSENDYITGNSLPVNQVYLMSEFSQNKILTEQKIELLWSHHQSQTELIEKPPFSWTKDPWLLKVTRTVATNYLLET